jgi:hypothetical protein
MQRVRYTRWRTLICACLFALPGVSSAWDGIVSGARVTAIDVTSAENFGFRVYLPPEVCGSGTPNWAYVTEGDSNYQAYVQALLQAKAMGLLITVYSNRDGRGFCHIGYLSVS